MRTLLVAAAAAKDRAPCAKRRDAPLDCPRAAETDVKWTFHDARRTDNGDRYFTALPGGSFVARSRGPQGSVLWGDGSRAPDVLLCGDAAHIWVPYAGYGMNAGIADAANLSWLLSATLNGWAPASILDAYERERLPITEQVSHFVMNHAHAMAKQRRSVPGNIEAMGQDGDRVRELTGRDAYKLNVQQYCAAGLNFGYFYDDSPIIAHEPEPPPAYTMSTFTASTLPGCRLPHLYLESGRSLYDLLGPEFTLLRLDPGLDVTVLTAAATHRCCPLYILDVTVPPDNSEYTHPLILVRPDQHVAWRGHNCPIDGLFLIDQIRGCTPA